MYKLIGMPKEKIDRYFYLRDNRTALDKAEYLSLNTQIWNSLIELGKSNKRFYEKNEKSIDYDVYYGPLIEVIGEVLENYDCSKNDNFEAYFQMILKYRLDSAYLKKKKSDEILMDLNYISKKNSDVITLNSTDDYDYEKKENIAVSRQNTPSVNNYSGIVHYDNPDFDEEKIQLMNKIISTEKQVEKRIDNCLIIKIALMIDDYMNLKKSQYESFTEAKCRYFRMFFTLNACEDVRNEEEDNLYNILSNEAELFKPMDLELLDYLFVIKCRTVAHVFLAHLKNHAYNKFQYCMILPDYTGKSKGNSGKFHKEYKEFLQIIRHI